MVGTPLYDCGGRCSIIGGLIPCHGLRSVEAMNRDVRAEVKNEESGDIGYNSENRDLRSESGTGNRRPEIRTQE